VAPPQNAEAQNREILKPILAGGFEPQGRQKKTIADEIWQASADHGSTLAHPI